MLLQRVGGIAIKQQAFWREALHRPIVRVTCCMQCNKSSNYIVYTVAGFGMKRWRQGNLLGEKDIVTNSHMSASLLKLNGCFLHDSAPRIYVMLSLVWELVPSYEYTSRCVTCVTWMRIIKTYT